MKATIVDLRYRMKEVLKAIDRGEDVTVLYRGKAKARLTPILVENGGAEQPKTEDQPFFGMYRDREDMSDPAGYVRKLREPRRFDPPDEGKRKLKRKAK